MREELKQLIKEYDQYIKSAEEYLAHLKEQRKAFVLTLKEVETRDKE